MYSLFSVSLLYALHYMFHCYQYKMLATVHKKLLSCLNESNNLQTKRKKKISTYQILIDMLTLENIEKILRRS